MSSEGRTLASFSNSINCQPFKLDNPDRAFSFASSGGSRMMKVVGDAFQDPRALLAPPTGDDFLQAKDRCPRYHDGAVHHRSVHSNCHILNATFPSMMAGLATMVILLFLSVSVLVCRSWRIVAPSGDQSSGQDPEDGTATAPPDGFETRGVHQVINFTPQLSQNPEQQDVQSSKVVVIMAGDEIPSFLALPVPTLMNQIKPGSASNQREPELPIQALSANLELH